MENKLRIFERRCFAVYTKDMLDFIKKKTGNNYLEFRITINPLDICLCNNKGDVEYDEEQLMELISKYVEVEINNMFFDGDKFGGVLYFTERKLE